MDINRWYRRISKEIYQKSGRSRHPKRKIPRISAGFLVVSLLFVAILASFALFDRRMRPIVETLAKGQVVSKFTEAVDDAILANLSEGNTDYDDFVTIQRGSDGNIQALITNMAEMNRLQAEIEDHVFQTLGALDVSQITIPLGSITGLELLWGRGPSLSAHALSIGVLNSEFISDFTAAGINQTRHRIYLDLQTPITIMMANTTIETTISTHLCVAETVIVGGVPNSFMQF